MGMMFPKENRVRNTRYREVVSTFECIHCQRRGPCQAAHPPPDGKQIKEDDRLCFPLCPDQPGRVGCHTKFDQYKLYPSREAREQARVWAHMTRLRVIALGLWPVGLPMWSGD